MSISINGSTGISGINGSAGTPALQGGDADTGIFFGTDTASIATAGSERLIVDASGNINVDSGGVYYDAANNRLGIGTSSADGMLHVKGANTHGSLILEAGGTSGTTNLMYLQGHNNAGVAIGEINFEETATNQGGFAFKTNGGSLTTKMTLTSGGSLGIGTTSPVATLDVNGQALFHGTTATHRGARIGAVTINNNTFDGTVDFTQGLVFSANSGNQGAWTQAAICAVGSTGYDGSLCFATDGDGLKNTTGLSEKARITSAGELLVGQTTESNLNVNIACPGALIGSHYIGTVRDSINSNDRTTLVHRMDHGSSHGFHLSGDLVVSSWTGNAFITVHITKQYNTDAIEVDIIQATHSAQVARSNVRVVTADYGSEGRYLGLQKNGGGVGLMFINAFMSSNMYAHGGVREVYNFSLGNVTEIAKLNY